METRNDDMEDLFRKSFENFEQEPPEELKALIDKQLQFKTKRGFGRFWYFGVLAIVLAISTLIYFNVGKTKKTELAQNTISKNYVDTPFSKNENNKQNGSNQSSQVNPLNSQSTDSSTFSTDNISSSDKKNNITKEVKKDIKKDEYTKNQTIKEKKIVESGQKTKSSTKNTSKVKKNKSDKSLNLPKLNKDFIAQNRWSEESVNKAPETQVENKTAKEAETVKNEEVKKDQSLIVKKDSTNNSKSNELTKDITETKDSSQITNQNTDKKEPSKTSPFLFAFKTDYLLPLGKQAEDGSEFLSKNAFHFQLEATYLLRPSLGVNSGVNYFSSSQSFSKSTTSVDSTFTGFSIDYVYGDSLQYIYDSTGNNIIDSVLITYILDSISNPNYEMKNVNSTQSSSFTISSFSIPLLFYYNQKLNSNLSLDLMAGGILNFQQIKFRDASNPLNSDLTLNKFGIKAILKTSLRYQFNHFGVSLNNTLIYDLKPVQYLETKSRGMSWGVGFGVFWRL